MLKPAASQAHRKRRKGSLVQARNGADGFGYVFVDCTLSSDPGVGDTYLARIEANRFPASQVAFVDCTMDQHIAPEGWLVTGGLGLQLRFAEFGSRDMEGNPLSTATRHSASTRLSAQQAEALRDPAYVLGFQP